MKMSLSFVNSLILGTPDQVCAMLYIMLINPNGENVVFVVLY